MGLFDFLSSKKEVQKTDNNLIKEDFIVHGTHYHPSEIKRLQNANPDWRKSKNTLLSEGKAMQRIYHYNFINKPVKIAVDNGDIYKKGALMVIIAGEHVGYIPDEDTTHVQSILKKKNVIYITSMISGGEYKVISENGEVVKVDSNVRISLRIAYS